jgi:long-chain acyl-CoA synthetase
MDSLFEQVMVIGEARPYLSALLVLNPDSWADFAVSHSIHPEAPDAFNRRDIERAVLERVAARLKDFPGYAQIRKITMTLDPWSVDEGLMTPTLKIKRPKVMEKFYGEIDKMYQGHSL